MSEKVLVIGDTPKASEIARLVQEALLVDQLVQKAAETQKHGSFAARNPAAGKMKTCPYCRIRERNHQCTAKILSPVSNSKSEKRRMRGLA